MTRLWPEGEIISVVSDPTYTPQSFTWQGRVHPVQQVAKRWRLDMDWWEQHIWREYFKLTTATGLMVVIYYDWLTATWYLQRLYD
ncbi:MAG: hypothetical protein KDJ97_24150 [Anaerolineae bacterium]|nr:hypothetical protein [Anaerolineae bacterium]